MFSPFSSLVNSRNKSSSVNFLLHSSSVPNSLGMGKKGIIGSESRLYVSTLSSTSCVLRRASGKSWKTRFISACVLNHSCLVYSRWSS